MGKFGKYKSKAYPCMKPSHHHLQSKNIRTIILSFFFSLYVLLSYIIQNPKPLIFGIFK